MYSPKPIDAVIGIFLVVLLTWHPYFAHGTLNLFELGLYLPGIDAIREGLVPYRDFFYLRGPLELYVPALLMNIFGAQVSVLNAYFYVGTVIAFIMAVLIAFEVIPNRFIFYCFVPLFVARVFPRVVFTFWGGMRFAIGLLGVYCLLRFLKQGKKALWWLSAAGILTICAVFTSVEIGAALVVACAGAILIQALSMPAGQRWRAYWTNAVWMKAGAYIVLAAYLIYLHHVGALMPFWDTMRTVTTRMGTVFPQTEAVPDTIRKFLSALINPGNKNFRQMTPVFCFLFFAVYFARRWQKKQIDWRDQAVAVCALYGIVMYAGAFRNLWASQFEMALMPSKIVLFFLLARACEYFKSTPAIAPKNRPWVVGVCLALIFATSIPYALGRFKKRFFVGQYAQTWTNDKDTRELIPFKGTGMSPSNVPRLKGSFVSYTQAMDASLLKKFLDQNTSPKEPVFMAPELGAMHFIVDRPWVGRFPTVTLSWLNDDWHHEMMRDLSAHPPRFAVLNKQVPDYFASSYFPVKANVVKYREMMDLVDTWYVPVAETPTYRIYRLKTKPETVRR